MLVTGLAGFGEAKPVTVRRIGINRAVGMGIMPESNWGKIGVTVIGKGKQMQ